MGFRELSSVGLEPAGSRLLLAVEQINNLMMHLNLLEKQEQTKPQTSRWRERAGPRLMKLKPNKLYNETKSWFFDCINTIDKPFSQYDIA
jgi:hypothetical protein